MASGDDVEQLKVSLERVRGQLAVLEATASVKPDYEISKLLKKAKSEESVILEKVGRDGSITGLCIEGWSARGPEPSKSRMQQINLMDGAVPNLCIGYTCICGERVLVARFIPGNHQTNCYPSTITVSCSRGHVATVAADQCAAMDHWNDLQDYER